MSNEERLVREFLIDHGDHLGGGFFAYDSGPKVLRLDCCECSSSLQVDLALLASTEPAPEQEAGEEEEPLKMYLCESSAVVLKPQTYRFVVDPNCEKCLEQEREGAPHYPDPQEPDDA